MRNSVGLIEDYFAVLLFVRLSLSYVFGSFEKVEIRLCNHELWLFLALAFLSSTVCRDHNYSFYDIKFKVRQIFQYL